MSIETIEKIAKLFKEMEAKSDEINAQKKSLSAQDREKTPGYIFVFNQENGGKPGINATLSCSDKNMEEIMMGLIQNRKAGVNMMNAVSAKFINAFALCAYRPPNPQDLIGEFMEDILRDIAAQKDRAA